MLVESQRSAGVLHGENAGRTIFELSDSGGGVYDVAAKQAKRG